jgi:hypothetical protein
MRQTDYQMGGDLRLTAALEDEVFLRADKLVALCSAQAALSSRDHDLPSSIRSHYALVLEEHAESLPTALGNLLG